MWIGSANGTFSFRFSLEFGCWLDDDAELLHQAKQSSPRSCATPRTSTLTRTTSSRNGSIPSTTRTRWPRLPGFLPRPNLGTYQEDGTSAVQLDGESRSLRRGQEFS
jgi:hypothetical protein